MDVENNFGVLFVFVLLVYIIGAFLTLDLNPAHWLMISTIGGRIIFLIMCLGVLFGDY